MTVTANQSNSASDLELWQQYKKQPNAANRSALLNRFSGIMQTQVNKWSGGNVPASALRTQAKVLAAKSFDTYDPSKGAALATHVTNNLLPLSRTVYTYQNTARMPENITMKVTAYNSAVNEFKLLHGREPTTDELHDKLGWSASEITRMRDYNVRDLMESGGEVGAAFYNNNKWESTDDIILGGVYMDLSPVDKVIFEHTTGYNNAKIMQLPEIAKKTGLSIPQIAYKKQLMRKQIDNFMRRPSIKSKYAS